MAMPEPDASQTPAPAAGQVAAEAEHPATDADQPATDADQLERFRVLVEHSEEGILELDAAERVTYVNRRMAELLDAPPATPLGRSISDLVDPDQLRAESGWSGRVDDPSTPVLRGEVTLPAARDWEPPRTLQVAAHVHRRDGEIHRITAVLTDVTERQLRLLELEEARAQHEEAQRKARLGHWRSDTRTGALTWSAMAYRIFGVTPDDFPATFSAFLELVHPADRDRVAHTERVALRQGSLDHTYRVRRPDGQERVVHELAERARGTDGVLVGTVQDITALHRAQEALAANEELLARVLRATNDGWWDANLVAGTAFHSARWWQIHGYEPGELEDTLTIAMELTDPEEVPRLQAELDRVVAERRESFTTRTWVRHREGHLVPVEVHGVVDYDDDGRPVRVSGALTDITDLVAAQRLQEEFVSTVSHALRTPLTTIGGALESLAGGVAGELGLPARSLVEMGLRNTARLRDLIDELLDLEGLLVDPSITSEAPQDLALLVRDAVELHGGLAASHQVRFIVTEQPEEQLPVRLQPARFQQVLGNFLSNAAKYAPTDSTVEVQVRAHGGYGRVEVVDRGPGVPDSFASRAFQRFAQADPSDPRSRGGTGLGPAITREIAERAGGRVGYSFAPGRTVFHVELPLHDPDETWAP